jgi:hypothetical protein
MRFRDPAGWVRVGHQGRLRPVPLFPRALCGDPALADVTQVELRYTAGSSARQYEAGTDDTHYQRDDPAHHVTVHAFGLSATGDAPVVTMPSRSCRIEKLSGGALTAPPGYPGPDAAVRSSRTPPFRGEAAPSPTKVCAGGLPPEQSVFHD